MSDQSSRGEKFFLMGSTLVLLGAVGLMLSINTLRSISSSSPSSSSLSSTSSSSFSSLSPIRWLASSIDPTPIHRNRDIPYHHYHYQSSSLTDTILDSDADFELEDVAEANYSSSSSTGSGLAPGTVPGRWASGFYYDVFPYATGANRTVCDISSEWRGPTEWKQYDGDTPPPVCVVIGLEKVMYKTIFRPVVDDFSVLQLEGSYNRSEWTDCSNRIAIEIGDYTTGPKPRFSQDCRMINPFWGIIIKLNNGVLSAIDWDEDCSLCINDAGRCLEGFCGVPLDECGKGIDCDIKIYTSWRGTDKDGNVLTSAGKRFSQFRRWSLSSAYNEAAKSELTDLPENDPLSDQANRFN